MRPALDIRLLLRRLKPEKNISLRRRPDGDLTFVAEEQPIGLPLLLDTCVYIHVLRGKTPMAVDRLLRTRSLYHSAVAVAEMSYRFGARTPAGARELAARKKLEAAIRDIPDHRLVSPTSDIWAEAGVLAGMRARIGGIGADARGMNDALIFLQARVLGAAVLTANVNDFDVLQQILPAGRVAFYRTI